MDITWHKRFAEEWLDRARQGRTPHAVLLAGPRGTGKRAAAAWIATRKLATDGVAELPQYPFERPEYADLHWLEVPEDKHTIGIDQVRALIRDLNLTSYEGRGKVAVIEPADRMTRDAANSLLKTLEEPPGDALIVLVADRTGHLPATIFSRCQRVDMPVPPEQEGLEWLDRLHPGTAWLEPLQVAGHAPLAALEAAEQLETSRSMADELAAVATGQLSPVIVAAKWSKTEPDFVLKWLENQVRLAIRASCGGRASAPGLLIPDSVLQRMDTRNLFCYQDIINRLRRQSGGTWKPELTFEALLVDWALGLTELGQETDTGGSRQSGAG
jgi:DNA polymerase-3 subunit delta'